MQDQQPSNSGSNAGNAAQIRASLQQVSFSGPLPPPEILRGYETLVSGAADRILSIAEEDAKHLRQIEMAALHAARDESRMGQIFGLIIGLAALGTTIAALILGSPTVAALIGGGTVVGLVSVFILGRMKRASS
jgi:uncharacterized membrane protein